MTGHLNLGHASHIPGFRVGDDLPDVPLREETTVAAIRPVGGSLLGIESETDVLATAHLRKLRITLDLHAPALIVGQVHVAGAC